MVRPMKNRAVFLLGCLFAFSCSPLRDGEVTRFAVRLPSDAETRVHMGAKAGETYPLLWSPGDRICVNGRTSSPVDIAETGTREAHFTFSGTLAAPFLAVHPESAYLDGTRLRFPSVQTHKDASCAYNSSVLAGRSQQLEEGIALQAVSGYIRFRIDKGDYSGTLKKLSLRGNGGAPLAGDFSLGFDADGAPELGPCIAPAEEVVLSALSASGEYIVALPPVDLPQGFTLTVYGSRSDFMRVRTTDPVRIRSGVLLNAPALSYAANGTLIDGSVPDYLSGEAPDLYLLTDFETRYCERVAATVDFATCANPLKEGINPSDSCLQITTAGRTYDCAALYSPFSLDYGLRTAEIRMKVLPPRANAPFAIKLSPVNTATCPETLLSCTLGPAGEWQEISFDLSPYVRYSNFYRRIYVYPDYGVKLSSVWYIDDLYVPDDDISAFSLFKRAAPPMLPDPSKFWMSNSIANPHILTPERTLDGKWWLLTRGGDKYKGRLGYYTQDAASFHPLGPWQYHPGNPIIDVNIHGEEVDSFQAIDPCGFVVDGVFYLYYKGNGWKDGAMTSTVLLATSSDGQTFTPVMTPWKSGIGVADVVQWNGKYWLYVARRIYEFTDLMSGEGAVEHKDILLPGGGPDNCDWYSINGGKLFYMDGRWFLFYQAGTRNPDFPGRFHVAWSSDMLHWTKVGNPRPLFTRGPRGAWDQGAIWAPSVFEWQGNLYMYYEGWGIEGAVPNRDEAYFLDKIGGHSQIGIAVCSKTDFLNWCGL